MSRGFRQGEPGRGGARGQKRPRKPLARTWPRVRALQAAAAGPATASPRACRQWRTARARPRGKPGAGGVAFSAPAGRAAAAGGGQQGAGAGAALARAQRALRVGRGARWCWCWCQQCRPWPWPWRCPGPRCGQQLARAATLAQRARAAGRGRVLTRAPVPSIPPAALRVLASKRFWGLGTLQPWQQNTQPASHSQECIAHRPSSGLASCFLRQEARPPPTPVPCRCLVKHTCTQ